MGGPARRHTHETEFTEFSCSTDVTVLKLYWSVLMNLTAANSRDRSPDTPSNTPNLYLIPTISNLNMNITQPFQCCFGRPVTTCLPMTLLYWNETTLLLLYSFVKKWNVPWKLPQLKKIPLQLLPNTSYDQRHKSRLQSDDYNITQQICEAETCL